MDCLPAKYVPIIYVYIRIYVCVNDRQDFSKNSKPVMSVYDEHLEFLVGERDSLSFYDIENLNLYYQCQGTKMYHYNVTPHSITALLHPGVLVMYCGDVTLWSVRG